MLVVHTERRNSVPKFLKKSEGAEKENKDLKDLKDMKSLKDSKDDEKKKDAKSGRSSTQPIFKIPWSMEEDELLINRRRKELSFAELLILLPQRTEGEIWARIDALERLRNGHRALVSKDHIRRRQSSLGLDDVDDFYDEVDSVIGGID
ncbi:hypothetical protein DND62_30365, partial [Pseudomonas syringae pv. pisi]